MSNRYARIYALSLLLLFPASILWWHLSDSRPSSMDETRHMQLAIDYRNWIGHHVPLQNEWSHVYPPLYHLSIIPALSVGTPSEAKVAMTYIFDLVVLLAGCLVMGRSAKRPDWESILAAFLCVGYDYVFWAGRRALIDFPLMAWTTFSVALLSLTEGFSSFRMSLLWGVALGVGLLIKAPFAFFMIGPLLWVFLTSPHPEKTKNVIASLALAAVISMPWYFWQSSYFLLKSLSLAAEPTAQGTDPRHLSGWLFYIQLLRRQLGLPSLIFTTVGIALAVRRRPEGMGLCLAWMASGYFILTLLINKDPRHSLPLLPAMAILAARGWGSVVNAPWKVFVLSLIGPLLLIYNFATYDLPAIEDWKHAPIISLLTRLHDPSQPFLAASILSHQPRFFARTLKWSAFREGVILKTVSPGDSDASFTEFVIKRSGNQGTEAAVLDKQWQELKPQGRAFLSLFSTCGRFPLPDGSEAVIYRRNPHPQFQVTLRSQAELERRLAHALQRRIQGPLKVSVDAIPAELVEGRLIRVRLTCDMCTINGLQIKRLEVVLEKPWFNLYRLWDEGRLGLLAFESLEPSCIIRAEDVQTLLSEMKGLRGVSVQFNEGYVRVRAHYKNMPIRARAHIVLNTSDYPGLDAVLDTLSLGGVPLPGWLLGKAHRQTLWLYPLPDFPGRILINHVTAQNGEMIIS